MTSFTNAPAPSTRWDADVLRGLTIMLMLLNLAPGSWAFNYGFLVLFGLCGPAFLLAVRFLCHRKRWILEL